MSVDLEKTKEIFTSLYADVDGRALSVKEREDKQYSSPSFIYGEVVPDSFYQILKEASPYLGKVFYDLGSGTGKAVMLAHLLFDFSESNGVELLSLCYQASVEVKNRYEKEFRPSIAKDIGDSSQISFLHGNFLDFDISDADFIFLNSVCFEEDLFESLKVKLESIRPHAHVVSISRPLHSPYFHQYKLEMYKFSWGSANAYFYRKLP